MRRFSAGGRVLVSAHIFVAFTRLGSKR